MRQSPHVVRIHCRDRGLALFRIIGRGPTRKRCLRKIRTSWRLSCSLRVDRRVSVGALAGGPADVSRGFVGSEGSTGGRNSRWPALPSVGVESAFAGKQHEDVEDRSETRNHGKVFRNTFVIVHFIPKEHCAALLPSI